MSSTPIILITGANTGLGYETIRSLCQSSKPYTILLGGRNIDKANTAAEELKKEFSNTNSTISTVQVDLEDDKSISEAFEHVSTKYGHLDILINNGGAQFDAQYFEGKMSMREVWNKNYDINTTGTHILTHTFIPLLLLSPSPSILFITSGMSSLSEQATNTNLFLNKSPEKGWPKTVPHAAAYRASKTGMNMMFREWVRILKEDGVRLWAVSPGFLATGLGGSVERNKGLGAEDPTLGANFVRDVVEGKWDEHVGKVVRRAGVQPW